MQIAYVQPPLLHAREIFNATHIIWARSRLVGAHGRIILAMIVQLLSRVVDSFGHNDVPASTLHFGCSSSELTTLDQQVNEQRLAEEGCFLHNQGRE